jgi:pathogenesis-related protein 1
MFSNYAMIIYMTQRPRAMRLVLPGILTILLGFSGRTWPQQSTGAVPALSGDALVQEALLAHNRERKKVGLKDLAWDAELAKLAQDWARHLCASGGGRGGHRMPTLIHRKARTGGPGENLWEGVTTEAMAFSISDAVKAWADERQYFDENSGTCRSGVCGHYTQVVWRATTHVGCGAATCSAAGMLATIWACNYSPAGNFLGERPY